MDEDEEFPSGDPLFSMMVYRGWVFIGSSWGCCCMADGIATGGPARRETSCLLDRDPGVEQKEGEKGEGVEENRHHQQRRLACSRPREQVEEEREGGKGKNNSKQSFFFFFFLRREKYCSVLLFGRTLKRKSRKNRKGKEKKKDKIK